MKTRPALSGIAYMNFTNFYHGTTQYSITNIAGKIYPHAIVPYL